jgi:hypothetical protein
MEVVAFVAVEGLLVAEPLPGYGLVSISKSYGS